MIQKMILIRILFQLTEFQLASLKKMAEDLSLHFANGGKMGNFLFQPKIVKQYKPTLQMIKYNNLPIKSEEDVKKIHAYARTKYCI